MERHDGERARPLRRGNTLILCSSEPRAESLRELVCSIGGRPIVLSGPEALLVDGPDDSIELVLTDLDPRDAAAQQVFERLASGSLAPDAARVHLVGEANEGRPLSGLPRTAREDACAHGPGSPELRVRARLGAEVGRLRRQLATASIRDPETGLLERTYVLARLEQEWARASRQRIRLSLVVAAIDVAVGAPLRRSVAAVLGRHGRREDLVGLLSRGRFVHALPGATCRGAAALANRVRVEVEHLVPPQERPGPGFSAGIATAPDNAGLRSVSDLLRAAHDALDEARERGGNRCFIDPGTLAGSSPLILVVDDDAALLAAAEDVLGSEDFRVATADSVERAIEASRFRVPDLIVIDLDLAPSSGGPSAIVDRLRPASGHAPVPVVGLTDGQRGGAKPPTERVDRLLTKPFSIELLRSVARELIEA